MKDSGLQITCGPKYFDKGLWICDKCPVSIYGDRYHGQAPTGHSLKDCICAQERVVWFLCELGGLERVYILGAGCGERKGRRLVSAENGGVGRMFSFYMGWPGKTSSIR